MVAEEIREAIREEAPDLEPALYAVLDALRPFIGMVHAFLRSVVRARRDPEPGGQ